MRRLAFALLCGLVFGIIDVLIMIPLKYENNRKRLEAMSAAFIERFMIGFLIPIIDLPLHPVYVGILLGLTLSLPSAIITRVYIPIVATGIAGGILVGMATTLF